jgi:AAA domain
MIAVSAAPTIGAMIEAISKYDCAILRGLPGSGKSTFANRLVDEFDFVRLEADDHFFVGGEYRFDPTRVADAHAVVVRDALAHLQAGRRVVVANTHAQLWEMAGIVGAATLAQKTFCFVNLIGQYDNIHCVPEYVITAMKARFHWALNEFADRVFTLTPDV